MANFNTHISVAFVASGVTGLVIYKAGMLTAPEYLMCVVAGTIGGLLPDIDLDHSVPATVGFNVVSLLTAFFIVILCVGQFSLVALAGLWLASYLLMRYGVFNLYSKLTVHRGIVHSIPYLGIMAMTLVYASFYGFKQGAVISWFLGLFLMFGAIVHLLLDEMFSVNLLGLSVKKSFGTAFKVFKFDQVGWYLGLYAVLAALIVFAPPFKLFWQTLQDPISWLILKKIILPTAINLPNIHQHDTYVNLPHAAGLDLAVLDSSEGVHHELSTFVNIPTHGTSRWYFLDPTVVMSVTQKQPRPCGSGEKYKRCCGQFLH